MIVAVTADCEGVPVRMLAKAGTVYASARDVGRLAIGQRGEHTAVTAGLRAVPHDHKTLFKHLILGGQKPVLGLLKDAFIVSQHAWRKFARGLGLHAQRADAIGALLDDHAARLRIEAMSAAAAPQAPSDRTADLVDAVRRLADVVERQQAQIEGLTQQRDLPPSQSSHHQGSLPLRHAH